MIGTTELQKRVNKYSKRCSDNQEQPTYTGLGETLGISVRTIRRIYKGFYDDKHAYTSKPHITRCVANADFELIRALFDNQ